MRLELRSTCEEAAIAACDRDPSLRLVRGHYWCPLLNTEEAHWWTVRPDGSIYDPTREQFMSAGAGAYTEFAGTITCEHCGQKAQEEEASFAGGHAYCSYDCRCRACL